MSGLGYATGDGPFYRNFPPLGIHSGSSIGLVYFLLWVFGIRLADWNGHFDRFSSPNGVL